MADINDLFKAAEKDKDVKDRWFKHVKPKFWPERTDDGARVDFDNTLFNFDKSYTSQRLRLAEAHLFRYNERERQVKRLYFSIATAAICAAAYFAPVEHKPEIAQMAAATLGLVGIVASVHYASKLRE